MSNVLTAKDIEAIIANGGDPNGPKRKKPQNTEIDAGSGFIVDLKNKYKNKTVDI